MTIKERIENLTKQQEKAREVFIKCQGAIEVLTEILNEKKK
jgi:hypothetical protein|tara:strand:+ start:4777 stop:4899 length:123 start_codon:yes stop_codon:yes gene_type:complete